jgi:hypothetical protein
MKFFYWGKETKILRKEHLHLQLSRLWKINCPCVRKTCEIFFKENLDMSV